MLRCQNESPWRMESSVRLMTDAPNKAAVRVQQPMSIAILRGVEGGSRP